MLRVIVPALHDAGALEIAARHLRVGEFPFLQPSNSRPETTNEEAGPPFERPERTFHSLRPTAQLNIISNDFAAPVQSS